MQEEQKEDLTIIQEIPPTPVPGFRFYPTEEELVSFYLHNMLEERKLEELNRVIPVINIYALEPWQLPKLAGEMCNGDTEQWFFFVPRQEREAMGGRPSRTTASGYWKATGSPSYVYSSDSREIGVKKSLVFYKGKAPTGRKTKWKMNEYRARQEDMPCSSTHPIPKLRHEVSLCRVYVVSGTFRAFDRRPQVGIGTSRETIPDNAASRDDHYSLRTTMMEGKSSLESSTLPKDEVLSDNAVSNGRNWEMVDVGLTNLFEYSSNYKVERNDQPW